MEAQVERYCKIYKHDFLDPSKWPGVATDIIVHEHAGPIIAVAEQYGSLVAWLEADTFRPKLDRYFRIVGTGWERPPNNYTHRGTTQIDYFVAHLYERTP